MHANPGATCDWPASTMKISKRGSILFLFLLTLLVLLPACKSPYRSPSSAPQSTTQASAASAPPSASIPATTSARTLDAYKTAVARQVMQRNPERVFPGELPPMLPAVVVVNITVDRAGELQDVRVQRSRDQGASEVALASLRRSGPLPRPDGLGPPHHALTMFSETFLFGERYRFQLRTLAGPQRSGL